MRRATPPFLTLSGHIHAVVALALNHRQDCLACGSRDGAVRLWELPSGRLIRTLSGPWWASRQLQFDPTDARLAALGGDQTLRIWEVATGKQLGAMRRALPNAAAAGQGGLDSPLPVLACGLSWAPDGKLLASSAKESAVRLWDPETASLRRTLYGLKHSAAVLAFAPNGVYLAAGTLGGDLRIWTLPGTRWIDAVPHASGVRALAWHPAGALIASAGRDGLLRLQVASTGLVIREWPQLNEMPIAVHFSRNGEVLGVAFASGILRWWDTETGVALFALNLGRPIQQLLWSADQRWLIAGGPGQAVQLWESPRFEPQRASIPAEAPPAGRLPQFPTGGSMLTVAP